MTSFSVALNEHLDFNDEMIHTVRLNGNVVYRPDSSDWKTGGKLPFTTELRLTKAESETINSILRAACSRNGLSGV